MSLANAITILGIFCGGGGFLKLLLMKELFAVLMIDLDELRFLPCRPFGQMIKPILDSMQVTPQGGHHPFQQAATANPPVAAAAANPSNQGEIGIQSPSVERQQQPSASLPKDLNLPTFSSEKAMESYNSSKSEIHAKCESDTKKLLDEFYEYVSTKEPTWSPSPRHISCFGK